MTNSGHPSLKATASVLKTKAAQQLRTAVPLKDGHEVDVAATGPVGVECDRPD